MIGTSHALIGPAATVQAAARAFARGRDRFALLLEGDPGVGKTHIADALALEIAGNKFAVEHVNGQSLGIELVRHWRESGAYGSLFSSRLVKRVDELDKASSSAVAELLTYLDYLAPGTGIIATTNEFAALRKASKGRLESRFVRYHVAAPGIDETAALVRSMYQVPARIARQIAAGAVPEGCLATAGCNVRAALHDAMGYMAARRSVEGRAA